MLDLFQSGQERAEGLPLRHGAHEVPLLGFEVAQFRDTELLVRRHLAALCLDVPGEVRPELLVGFRQHELAAEAGQNKFLGVVLPQAGHSLADRRALAYSSKIRRMIRASSSTIASSPTRGFARASSGTA